MSAYGDFDSVLATLVDALTKGPFLLGERFSAVDILWGSALAWTTGSKLVPEDPTIMAYVARRNARAAVRTVVAREADLAAEQEAVQNDG